MVDIESTIAKIIDDEYRRKKSYEELSKNKKKDHKNKEKIKK